MPEAMHRQLREVAPDLAEVLTVASVDVAHGDALAVQVTRTTAAQCQRCWRHRPDVGGDSRRPDLCARCAAVLSGWNP
jgi:isoleucyl-tRNA synthetase